MYIYHLFIDSKVLWQDLNVCVWIYSEVHYCGDCEIVIDIMSQKPEVKIPV